MAVQSTLAKSALALRYISGVDSKGNDVIKAKKFTNVKVEATAQNIYDAAQALAPLMKYPMSEIVRTDDSVLINA